MFHPQPSNLFKDIQSDFICLVGYPTVLSLPTACDRGTTRWRSPTAPEKTQLWKMIFLLKWVIFRFHVNFPGGYLLKFGVLQVPIFMFGGVFLPTASVFYAVKIWTTPSFRWGCFFRSKRWFHWVFDHAGYIKTWHLFKPHVEELFIRRLGAQKKTSLGRRSVEERMSEDI